MPQPVLVVYTGGTIGSKPRDPDPDSPQVVVPWEELKGAHPEIEKLGFPVDCVSTPTPLDSCNIGPAEWRFMAEAIEENYEKYSGFVILHGTDTMVYTASALSFMLRNLGKPVVLSGAQRSAMVDVRNDARQNFITSLLIANPAHARIPIIPEVVIFFGGLILRGCRAIKRDTAGYSAYETPNLAPLGEAGDAILIDPKLLRPMPTGRFNARKTLDTNVLPVLIYPGVQETDIVRRQLDDPGPKAAIVMSFGSGNIPTKPEFLQTFRDARKRGVVIANVSQCPRGPVELGIYETSAELLEAGFVSGNDMTLEAAQCKLMVLLGDPDLRDPDIEPEERQQIVERRFEVSMAGEQSTSIYVTDFGNRSAGSLDAAGGTPARARVRAATVEGQFEGPAVSRAILRLHQAELTSTDRKSQVQFRVFLNLDPEAQPDNADPGFGGQFRKWAGGDKGLMVFDITAAFKATVQPGDRVSPTIVVDSAGSDLTWERAELAVFVNERAD